MSENLHGFPVAKAAIAGVFQKDVEFVFKWSPEYLKEFPIAVKEDITKKLEWNYCKFTSAAKNQIPDKFGVYCFSVELNYPFPQKIHIPMYIGKASTQFLSERFSDYITEKKSEKGRESIILMLNYYKHHLYFWWAELPKVYVDTVEEHLLMCCKPACNNKSPRRDILWGKAFEI